MNETVKVEPRVFRAGQVRHSLYINYATLPTDKAVLEALHMKNKKILTSKGVKA